MKGFIPGLFPELFDMSALTPPACSQEDVRGTFTERRFPFKDELLVSLAFTVAVPSVFAIQDGLLDCRAPSDRLWIYE